MAVFNHLKVGRLQNPKAGPGEWQSGVLAVTA